METSNFSSMPLEFSFENISADSKTYSFDEYQYGVLIAKRELKVGELPAFTLAFELGKQAVEVLTQIMNSEEEVTEKLIATFEKLKVAEENKGLNFFDLKAKTEPKKWNELMHRIAGYNKFFRNGITIANFAICDGSIKTGDIAVVNDPMFESIYVKVVWAEIGGMITVLTLQGEAFSIGNGASIKLINPELLPAEIVSKLNEQYEASLKVCNEYKAKFMAKIEARQKKEQEKVESAITLEKYSTLLRACETFEQVKELNTQVKELKLTNIDRNAWKTAVELISKKMAQENLPKIKEAVEAATTIDALKTVKIDVRKSFLLKSDKEALLALIAEKMKPLVEAEETAKAAKAAEKAEKSKGSNAKKTEGGVITYNLTQTEDEKEAGVKQEVKPQAETKKGATSKRQKENAKA